MEADAGVRISKTRRWESAETDEMIEGEWGENDAEYVQVWVGSVSIDWGRSGDHCVEEL